MAFSFFLLFFLFFHIRAPAATAAASFFPFLFPSLVVEELNLSVEVKVVSPPSGRLSCKRPDSSRLVWIS